MLYVGPTDVILTNTSPKLLHLDSCYFQATKIYLGENDKQ